MNAARKGRLLVWSENVNITNVEWVQDRRGRCALELRLDGRSAHFDSSQRSSLLDRGIIAGISYLRSERRDLMLNPYVHGSYGPAINSEELVGCTDDAGVFTLFTEMCNAIRNGTWVAGARQPSAQPLSA